MSLIKRLGQSETVRRAACALAAGYIRLVFATSRWTVRGEDIPARYWESGKPFILAFWHGRILMMPKSWRTRSAMNMLISRHRDGELIAQTIAHFGLKAIRGSAAKDGKDKPRGGASALLGMMRAVRDGEYVGITPDGPRGPRMRAGEGVAALAKLSGLPVIPAAFGTRNRIVLGSWDRFVIALPFGRGAFVWGEPVHVARDATPEALEAARAAIEAGLNAVTWEADRLAGAPRIEPDDAPGLSPATGEA